MNVYSLWPSRYVKAEDLQGKEITVTIDRVVMEKIGQPPEEKPIIYFRNANKGLVCNRTNGMMIAGIYGPETTNWVGKAIVLYSARVNAFGAIHLAIRVKAPPKGTTHSVTVEPPAPATSAAGPNDIDDLEDVVDDADADVDDANPFDEATEPPPGHADPSAVARATDWQLNEISTIGKQIHGNAWDTERAKYAEWVSKGTVNALSELTAKEAKQLIEAMRKKLSKMAAEVQSNGKG